MPAAKIWVLILIGNDISGTVGPVPYDMKECRSRVTELNRENSEKNLPEGFIRFTCEESATRPRWSGVFEGRDVPK